jgi:uncharacterized membrane protein
MMTTPLNPQVDAYLRQLDFALSTLPWDQRNEIFTDISEHIQRELAAAGDDPAAVDDVLQRVGDPHVIAQEAGAPPAMSPLPPPPPPRRGRGLEIAAILLISAGSFLVPFVGWIVGVALLWVSSRFTRADKMVGTLVPPFGFLAPFFLLFAAGTASSGPCVSEFGGNGRTVTHCAATVHHGLPAAVGIGIVLLLLAAAVYTVVRLSRRVARMS